MGKPLYKHKLYLNFPLAVNTRSNIPKAQQAKKLANDAILKRLNKAHLTENQDKENINTTSTPLKKAVVNPGSTLLTRSKKISKPLEKSLGSSRAILGDITNKLHPNTTTILADMTSSKQSKKPNNNNNNTKMINPSANFTMACFLEDNIMYTTNYTMLTYANPRTKRAFNFKCYQDKELNFPINFAEKTITHSRDNDCTTDEDLIEGAKNNLRKSIEECLKEQREQDQTWKKNSRA